MISPSRRRSFKKGERFNIKETWEVQLFVYTEELKYLDEKEETEDIKLRRRRE